MARLGFGFSLALALALATTWQGRISSCWIFSVLAHTRPHPLGFTGFSLTQCSDSVGKALLNKMINLFSYLYFTTRANVTIKHGNHSYLPIKILKRPPIAVKYILKNYKYFGNYCLTL